MERRDETIKERAAGFSTGQGARGGFMSYVRRPSRGCCAYVRQTCRHADNNKYLAYILKYLPMVIIRRVAVAIVAALPLLRLWLGLRFNTYSGPDRFDMV